MDTYNQILQLLEQEFHLSEGTQYIPDEKIALLKKISALLESCWADFFIDTLELLAGPGNHSLQVSLISVDLVSECSEDDPFLQLVKLADSVSFYDTDGGNLRTCLHFKELTRSR